MYAENQEQYLAYILRLWRQEPDRPWYAMLETIPGGERHSFPSMEEAMHYLKTQTLEITPTAQEIS